MTTPAYLVQYGRAAYVGRFAAPPGVSTGRGDRVVVRTPRGVELGVVLCEADDRFAGALDPAAGGDLLRAAGPPDEAAAYRADATARALLTAAGDLAAAAGLPLAVLDAEVLLDGSAAVLHVLPWEACDADGLFADLSARTGFSVRALDVSRTPTAPDAPDAAGCGKPGCGTEAGGGCGTGGGCSSGGGCSRGKVKSAGELTAYFADLRGKMEADAARRTPLR